MAANSRNKRSVQVLNLSELQENPDADEKALDQLLNELEGKEGTQLDVYRQGSSARELDWLFDCGVSDYTLDQLRHLLRDRYGVGKYRLYVRIDGKIAANSLVSIGGPLQLPGTHVTAPANHDAALQKLIDAQTSQLVQMRQDLNRTLEKLQSDGGGGMKQLQEFALVMKLLGVTAPRGGGGNGLGDINDMFEIMDRLEERATGRHPRDEPDGWLPVVEKAVNGFVDIFAPQSRAAPRRAADRQALPRPRVTQPADQVTRSVTPSNPAGETQPATGRTAQSQLENDNMNMMVTVMLRARAAQIRTLLDAAAADADPAGYVQMTLDAVPAQVSDEQLLQALEHPDALTIATQYVPAAAPYAPWFDELRKLLVDSLKGEEAESDPNSTKPAPDIGSDAGADSGSNKPA